MSITFNRTDTDVLVLEDAQTLLEGTPVQLFTEDELQTIELERRTMLDLQMPSFLRGDEDVDAETIFDLSAEDQHCS